MNNIRGVFCGHDHNNDFYGDYYGISLYYGRKTGYGGYGPPSGMLRGTRVLEFTYN
jgi:pre-mRNA-splicing factor SYF1